MAQKSYYTIKKMFVQNSNYLKMDKIYLFSLDFYDWSALTFEMYFVTINHYIFCLTFLCMHSVQIANLPWETSTIIIHISDCDAHRPSVPAIIENYCHEIVWLIKVSLGS